MALVGSVSGSSTYDSRIGITGSIVFAGADIDYGTSFPTIGSDVGFYVSGSSGGKDSATDRGVSVFGGDTVVSGALEVGVSGSGQDVKLYGGVDGAGGNGIGLHWDADAAERGKLILGANDYGVDFQVFGETSSKYLRWDQSADTFYLWGSLSTRYNQVFDASSQGWDFTVNSNSRVGIFVDGSEDQIYILSGGDGTGPASPNPANATDLAFFVSGTIGSKDTSVKGTSVFGGDLVASGALYSEQGFGKTAVTHDLGTGASLTQNTRGGSITFTMNAALGANQQGQYLNVTSSQLLETDVIVCSTSYAHMFAQPSAVFQSGSGAFQIQLFNWSGTTVPDDTTFTLNWTAL